MELLNTLRTLCTTFGPSGQEKEIASVIAALAAPYADEISRDVLGNLIVHKKGSGPKVMFAAHMDSIGLMVTHITDEGFLRVGKLGGISPRDMLGIPVRFQNGVMGMVYEDDELGDVKREMGHLFIDIGAKNAEEARERVQVGDAAVFAAFTNQSGHALISPYLDNRVSCLALLWAMELLEETDNDLYFVFTTQEEVGTRGAQTAAYAIDSDYAVIADVTIADDLPGSKHTCSSKCGGGAAIKVMDSLVICHPEMVDMLKKLAEEKQIPFQMDVISGGGTDGGPIHKSRAGVFTGGVSVPCRNTHCPQEVAYAEDVEAVARLLAAFAAVAAEIVIQAVGNIRHGDVFGESFLMTIAGIGAVCIGEIPEGVMVFLLYRLGEYLQTKAVSSSRKSISALLDVRPDHANLLENGESREVEAESVSVGQTILVRPGEKVPLDGVVLRGASQLDTAALTGESMPREIASGQQVMAGCINLSGALEIRVEKSFGESTASKILEMVENASEKKASSEKFITRFARVYTPIVWLAAAVVGEKI